LTGSWLSLFLLSFPALLTACASAHDPHWFEALSRLPIKTIHVDGHRLAYLDVGEGSPIVLIHGLGGSMWQWEHQLSALAAKHRVIVPDLLGSGLSDKPDLDYTPDHMLGSFRGLLDALHLDTVSLVGNSMGGGLAIALAVTQPTRVEHLILIGGFPDHVRDRVASPLFQQALDSRAPVWVAKLVNWLAGRALTTRVLREIIHDERTLTPAVVERAYRNRSQPGFIPPLLAIIRNLPLWETGFARHIGEIRQPTLIVWGANDRLFPSAVADHLHATIPGSRVVTIPEAGHLSMWERPELVNPLLLEFLGP
jgi:pimeloyl-ACP methyl ester carboxylesterase